jgi:hypothetical protein
MDTRYPSVDSLAPVIREAMRRCRKDFDHTMGDHYYCTECPLLLPCCEQKQKEKA